MIRTRREIDEDHKRITEFLGEALEEKVQSEEFYKNEINMLRDQLKELNNEACFEATSAGQIHQMELEADEKIRLILKELSQKTGHNYLSTNELSGSAEPAEGCQEWKEIDGEAADADQTSDHRCCSRRGARQADCS